MKIHSDMRTFMLVAGLCLAPLAGTSALSVATATAAEQATRAESQYSEQDLRAYAFANAGVRLIQGGLDRRLVEVGGDEQTAQQLQREAQEQQTATIQRAGLTIESYDRMTQEIAANAELTETVQDYVDEEMGIVRARD